MAMLKKHHGEQESSEQADGVDWLTFPHLQRLRIMR